MDLNRIVLIGRLATNPEYKAAGYRGQPHCFFMLAINRVVPNAQGPQADYVPCSLWGEEAQKFVENRAKGDEVGVVGRLRTTHLKQADGSYKNAWEVRVDRVSYGRRSLKNLQGRVEPSRETEAVSRLSKEFGG